MGKERQVRGLGICISDNIGSRGSARGRSIYVPALTIYNPRIASHSPHASKQGLSKGQRSASSAAAAERLATFGAGGAFGSFGAFGAFGGGGGGGTAAAAPAASLTSASPEGDDDYDLSAVDGEFVQHLQRLSKRDPTTRLKALQALRSLAGTKATEDIQALLPAWAFYFKRVALDNSKPVRIETAGVMGAFAVASGRKIAPHLAAFLPHWYLLAADPNPEVAGAARAALEAAFPQPEKQRGALCLFGADIVRLAGDVLASSPQALGDAKRESPEELQDRHERALCSALSATGALAELVHSVSGQPSAPPHKDLRDALSALYNGEGFWRRGLGAKAAIPRRAAAQLLGSLCTLGPAFSQELIEAPARKEALLQVLALLGDRDITLHSVASESVMRVLKAWGAGGWELVGDGLRKAVLPRIFALFRSGGNGSPEVLFSAAVFVLASLPKELLGPNLEVLADAIAAHAEGWATLLSGAYPSKAAQASFASSFVDLVRLTAARDSVTTDGSTLSAAVGSASLLGRALSEDAPGSSRQEAAYSATVAACEALNPDAAARVYARIFQAFKATPGPNFASLQPLIAKLRPLNGDGLRSALLNPVAQLCHERIASREDKLGHAASLLAFLVASFGIEAAAVVPAGAGDDDDASSSATSTLESLLAAFAASVPGTSASLSTCQLLAHVVANLPTAAQPEALLLCSARILGVEGEGEGTRSGLEGYKAALQAAQPSAMKCLRQLHSFLVALEQLWAPRAFSERIATGGEAGARLGHLLTATGLWLVDPAQLGKGEPVALLLVRLRVFFVIICNTYMSLSSFTNLSFSESRESCKSSIYDIVLERTYLNCHIFPSFFLFSQGCLLRCGVLDESGTSGVLTALATRLQFAETVARTSKVQNPIAEVMTVTLVRTLREACLGGGVHEAPGHEGFVPLWISVQRLSWTDTQLAETIEAALDQLMESGRGLASYIERSRKAGPAAARLPDAMISELCSALQKSVQTHPAEGARLRVWSNRSTELLMGLYPSSPGRAIPALDGALRAAADPMARAVFLGELVRHLGTAEVFAPRDVDLNVQQLQLVFSLFRATHEGTEGGGDEVDDEETDGLSEGGLRAATRIREEIASAASDLCRAAASTEGSLSESDESEHNSEAGGPGFRELDPSRFVHLLAATADALLESLSTDADADAAVASASSSPQHPSSACWQPVRGLLQLLPCLGQLARHDVVDARDRLHALFRKVQTDAVKASLQPRGHIEDIMAALTAPLYDVKSPEYRAYLAQLVDGLLTQPHPLVLAADHAFDSAFAILASLKILVASLPSCSASASSAALAAVPLESLLDLTKRLVTGARGAKRSLGLMGARWGGGLSTDAHLPEIRHIGMMTEGCTTALALRCLRSRDALPGSAASSSASTASALSSMDLLSDHVREALASVTSTMEEVAESSSAMVREILRDGLKIDLEDVAPDVPAAEFCFRLAANGKIALPPTLAEAGVTPFQAIVTWSENAQSLKDLTDLRAAEAFAAAAALVSTSSNGPEDWSSRDRHTAGDIFRCLLSLGAASANVMSIFDLASSKLDPAGSSLERISQRFSAQVASRLLRTGELRTSWSALALAVERMGFAGDLFASALEEADAWAQEALIPTPRQALVSLVRLELAAGATSLFAGPSLMLPMAYAAAIEAGPLAFCRDLGSRAEGGGGGDDDGEGEQEESAALASDSYADTRRFLVSSGLQPQTATCIAQFTLAPPSNAFLVRQGLFVWSLCFRTLQSAEPKTRQRLAKTFSTAWSCISSLLTFLGPRLPLEGKDPEMRSAPLIARVLGSEGAGSEDFAWQCGALFTAALAALPASGREWFNGLRDRGLASRVERFALANVCALMARNQLESVREDVARLEEALGGGGDFEMLLRTNMPSRELVASIEIEDNARMEIAIKLPASFPLRPAEVEARQRPGISDARARKWVLSITMLLRNENGSLAEALALWRRNVEKEFQGLEPCCICYSVVHPSNSSLPSMHCKTCSQCLHAMCLYQWFKSSGKSTCPHCQSPWS